MATPALDSSPQRGISVASGNWRRHARQAAKAALGGVRTPTLLTRTVAGAQDVGARTKAPTPLACSVPLTELLRGQGLTTALLLLARTTTGATPLRRPATSSTATPAASAASATTATSAASSTATTSATSAPTATAAAASASTAATDSSTPTSTPTATPTPPAASTSTSTAPARSSSAPAPLALARAASPARGRRRTDRLKTKEVGRSSRGNRLQKGGGGTPLKDGAAWLGEAARAARVAGGAAADDEAAGKVAGPQVRAAGTAGKGGGDRR
ncbi:unnamed protein product [Closterium sp. NIES-64]|nr:unnamed protein product [Closterium sp. NIES-64]